MTIHSSPDEVRSPRHSTTAAPLDERSPTPPPDEAADRERTRRDVLAALPHRTGRTLEIGEDEGELGRSLAGRASVLVRLEPDPARARRLAAKGFARVRAGGIEGRLPLRHYKTIVCIGQLDKVPLREAPRVRERLCRGLASGGTLLLQHGVGADTLHPPFLDHGLETVSLDVVDGIETIVLRRPRARLLGDAGRVLLDVAREPWPAPAPPSSIAPAEADLETGHAVGRTAGQRTRSTEPRARRLLLRVGDRPATVIVAAGPPPSRLRLATELAPRVAPDLVDHLRTCPRNGQDMVAAVADGHCRPRHPLSSAPRRLEPGELVVAVCTARGPDVSAELIGELAATFDVVVQENGTEQPQLGNLCAAAGVTYRHDPRPGLAAARNRVMAATQAEWVLFLDDDCRLGPGGGPELARRLGGAIDRVPDAGSIGGLVLPSSLEHAPEQEFERLGGHGRGFLPARHDAYSWPDRWWPLRHGDWMAVGACLAVRRQAWEAVGGFDERLGAGTPSASAEDDAFLGAVVEHGWSVFYEPAIVVRHEHRPSWWGLRRQLFGYGLGRSVQVLLRALDTRDWRVLSLWAELLAEGWRTERLRPRRLGGPELLGYLAGPIVALDTARRFRPLHRHSVPRP